MSVTVAVNPAAISQHSSRPKSSCATSKPVPVNPSARPAVPKSRSANAREPINVKDLSRRHETISREKRTHHKRHSSNPSNAAAIQDITVTSGHLPYVPRNAAKAFARTTDVQVISKRKSMAPPTRHRASQIGVAVLMPDKGKQDPVLAPTTSVEQRWEGRDTEFDLFDPKAERQRLYNAGIMQLSSNVGDTVARPILDKSRSEFTALIEQTAKSTTRARAKSAYYGGPKTALLENLSGAQNDKAHDPAKRRTRIARYDRTNWAQASQCNDDMLFPLLAPARRQSPSYQRDESPDEAGKANRGGPKRTSFHEQYQDPLQPGMIAEAVRILRDQATAPAAYAVADHHSPLNYPNVIDITELSLSAPASPAVALFPIASSKDSMSVKTSKDKEPRGLSLRRYFRPNRQPGGAKVEGKESKPVQAKSWMDMIEEMGIRNGIMVDDERWEAPIVRY